MLWKMTKIKVGQVWKNDYKKIVITYKHKNLKVFCYIDNEGVAINEDEAYFLRQNYMFLAEYPTWQEAVNSQEFRE